MNTPVVIASALAAAGIAVAGWTFLRLQQATESSAVLAQKEAAVRRELTQARQQLAAANERMNRSEQQAASLKEDLGRLFAKNTTPPPSVPTLGSPPAQTGFRAAPLRRTSPLVQRTTPTLRALDTTYHALYRKLRLTPAQIADFKTVLTDATARFDDLGRQAKQRGIGPRDPEIQPLFAQADADYRRAITDRFGEKALPALEHFTETLFLRDAIAQWSTALFYTETPINESQADQLVEVMSKNMRDPAGRVDTAFADGPAMIADATPILAAGQQPHWREFIDDLRKSSFASLMRPIRR